MARPELPAPVKQALLERVRNEIGPEEYRRLVDRMGEDEVLDQLIRAAEAHAHSVKPRKRLRDWWPWLVAAVLILPVFAGHWEGVLLLLVMALPGLMQWLFDRIAEWWRSFMPRI